MERGHISFFTPFFIKETGRRIIWFACSILGYMRRLDYVAKLIYGLKERIVVAVFQMLC